MSGEADSVRVNARLLAQKREDDFSIIRNVCRGRVLVPSGQPGHTTVVVPRYGHALACQMLRQPTEGAVPRQTLDRRSSLRQLVSGKETVTRVSRRGQREKREDPARRLGRFTAFRSRRGGESAYVA